jgi:hypothetical protein
VDRGGGPENPPSSSTTPQAASNIVQPPAPTSDVSNPSSSVAALLSQLNSSEWVTPSRTPQPQPASYFSMQQTSARSSQPASQPNPQPSENIVRHPVAPSIGARASTLGLGLRMMSFQQALPHLTELAENTDFVASISQVRTLISPHTRYLIFAYGFSYEKNRRIWRNNCGKNGSLYKRNTRIKSRLHRRSPYMSSVTRLRLSFMIFPAELR